MYLDNIEDMDIDYVSYAKEKISDIVMELWNHDLLALLVKEDGMSDEAFEGEIRKRFTTIRPGTDHSNDLKKHAAKSTHGSLITIVMNELCSQVDHKTQGVGEFLLYDRQILLRHKCGDYCSGSEMAMQLPKLITYENLEGSLYDVMSEYTKDELNSKFLDWRTRIIPDCSDCNKDTLSQVEKEIEEYGYALAEKLLQKYISIIHCAAKNNKTFSWKYSDSQGKSQSIDVITSLDNFFYSCTFH